MPFAKPPAPTSATPTAPGRRRQRLRIPDDPRGRGVAGRRDRRAAPAAAAVAGSAAPRTRRRPARPGRRPPISGANLHAAVRDQAQVLRHVAVLGPAHVADRVVEAALLVPGVVASGAVRARDEEVELLLVEVARGSGPGRRRRRARPAPCGGTSGTPSTRPRRRTVAAVMMTPSAPTPSVSRITWSTSDPSDG